MMHPAGTTNRRLPSLVEPAVMLGLFALIVVVIEMMAPLALKTVEDIALVFGEGMACLGQPAWAC